MVFTPRMTPQWKRQADVVVSFITANPGCTGPRIAYQTGISTSRVHQIIMHDARAKQLASQGYVAVNDKFLKPDWYYDIESRQYHVPVVRGHGIEVVSTKEHETIRSTFRDPKLQAQVLDLYERTKKATLAPSGSVTKRRKASNEILSAVHIIGEGLQVKIDEVTAINQRLERIEHLMLTRRRKRTAVPATAEAA